MKYDSQKIEKKWQKRWEKARLYEVKDEAKGRENFYHLVMFPYPSGDLHIGHWYNFAPADMYARFKRAQGYNVLSPFGFDAFGLPAENAAIKRKLHPAAWTFQNIEKMRDQIKNMGAMYDWSREVITCQPEYYRWTQWMFLQLYKAGLAERKRIFANWCPSCKTVLANEQVVDGLCERCESEVIQKQIDQWVFLITRYAERLLGDVEALDWPEKTKAMQRNWIGRSEGLDEYWQVEGINLQLPTFTTWPHTSYGATFLALAPEHPAIEELIKGTDHEKGAHEFIQKIQKQKLADRTNEGKEKEGYFTGRYAINHLTGWKMPVYIANFAIMDYGTGIVKGCPAHDQRDFLFAKKYDLDIKVVVTPKDENMTSQDLKEAYTKRGVMVNADRFDGMDDEKAKIEIADYIVSQGNGKKVVHYKIRDWIVSRQRYWGAPIPIVYCPSCGTMPVAGKDLPVLLPDIENFEPTGTGQSPLAKSEEFVRVKCPKCKGPARRETDTMDTFVDSSWYFLRYADPQNNEVFASEEKMRAWLPVDMYIGGAEHSVLHLLYARFFTKALHDLGFLRFEEPFLQLRHQGIILGPDGQKMSKSRGNVIDPDELVSRYGADTVRSYLAFMGPYQQGGPWSPGAINGVARFLERVYRMVTQNVKRKANLRAKRVCCEGRVDNAKGKSKETEKLLHKTIKKVTEDLEALKFNTAISALMVLVNEMNGSESSKEQYEILVKLLSPFAPHMSEELWQKLGHKTSVHKEAWPQAEERFLKEDDVTLVVQVNGTLRGKLSAKLGTSEEEAKTLALGDSHVAPWLQGKTIQKVIFVKDRLINFVT